MTTTTSLEILRAFVETEVKWRKLTFPRFARPSDAEAEAALEAVAALERENAELRAMLREAGEAMRPVADLLSIYPEIPIKGAETDRLESIAEKIKDAL